MGWPRRPRRFWNCCAAATSEIRAVRHRGAAAIATRKFIAGAICPECREVDRIVLEVLDGARRRRCVSCGHTDTMVNGATQELPTRVTRGQRRDVPATSVRIVDPRSEND